LLLGVKSFTFFDKHFSTNLFVLRDRLFIELTAAVVAWDESPCLTVFRWGISLDRASVCRHIVNCLWLSRLLLPFLLQCH
jgi:hypothetical protein